MLTRVCVPTFPLQVRNQTWDRRGGKVRVDKINYLKLNFTTLLINNFDYLAHRVPHCVGAIAPAKQ